jgi:transcription initiation factor IIE alpha subunit
MALEKSKKLCPQCETKYTIEWDIEMQDLEPLTCPFCGYEVDFEDYDENETKYEQAEDDSWD